MKNKVSKPMSAFKSVIYSLIFLTALNSFAQTKNEKAIEALFYIESSKSVGLLNSSSVLNLAYKDPYSLGLVTSEVNLVSQIRSVFYQQGSYSKGLSWIQQTGANLTFAQKQVLLSMIGSDLAEGYSQSTSQNTNLESLYQNAVRKDKEGGICGDIHTFLAQVAASLNMTAVGTTSLQWQKDADKNRVSGHAVSYFQDPTTGLIYVQNYSQIFSTGQKDLIPAIDAATKIYGALTGTVSVNTREDVMHQLVPSTSRWVDDQIKQASNLNPKPVSLKFEVSDKSYAVRGSFGRPDLQLFMGASQYESDQGPYRLAFVGVSSQSRSAIRFNRDHIIDEIFLATHAAGGVLNIQAPMYDEKTDQMVNGSQNNIFGQVSIKGGVRINKVTGSIEFVGSANDYNLGEKKAASPYNRLNLELQKEDKDFVYGVGRSMALLPRYLGGSAKESRMALSTVYDKISFIYQPKDNETNTTYLVLGNDLYFMEGVEKMSAIAVKTFIEKTLQVGVGSTFTVVADYVDYVQNSSKDPFYSGAATRSVKMQLEKDINFAGIKLGVLGERTIGQGHYPFANIGENFPDGSTKRSNLRVYFTVPLFPR